MTVARRKKLSELVVHIGAGFAAKERPHVRLALASLRPWLGNGDGNDVSVEISVQDRGRGEQRVTLSTTPPGRPTVTAVVADVDLTRALHEAKRQLARQLELRPAAPSLGSGGRTSATGPLGRAPAFTVAHRGYPRANPPTR